MINCRKARKSDLPHVCRFLTAEFHLDYRADAAIWLHEKFDRGEFNPEWLYFAESKEKIVAATYFQLDQGAGATILGFRSIDDASTIAMWQLAETELRVAGVKVIQSINKRGQSRIDPKIWKTLDFLGPASLHEMKWDAKAIYHGHLAHEEGSEPWPGQPCHAKSSDLGWASSPLQLEAYHETNAQEFATLLVRTYEDSLDLPELNHSRTADEVLRNHLERHVDSAGEFHFHTVLVDGENIGVLLLIPRNECWELSYLGIVPEFRGRGWGRKLLEKAMEIVRKHDGGGLTLTVDSRNLPARKIYDAAGFVEIEIYDVYFRII